MQITPRNQNEHPGAATVLSLKGQFVAEDADRFRKAVVERLGMAARDFVLDLSPLDFIDSRGLESLLWLQDQADERLGQVRLAGCRESIRKILEMTRLADRFSCHSDVATAERSLF